ncbi:MAG: hypothetical protein LWY06_07080 [Firmicutes bacterium]|nr:hypothetical protein [Bacillota bacterium]
MKRYFSFIAAAVIFAVMLTATVFAAENTDKKSRSVMLTFNLKATENGKLKEIRPKVAVMDGKTATITIGDKKATLNKKEVPTDKAMKEGTASMLTNVEATPEIADGTNPQRIKLDIKFYFQDGSSVISQNFKITVIENEPFTFTAEDANTKKKVEMTVTAEIRK